MQLRTLPKPIVQVFWSLIPELNFSRGILRNVDVFGWITNLIFCVWYQGSADKSALCLSSEQRGALFLFGAIFPKRWLSHLLGNYLNRYFPSLWSNPKIYALSLVSIQLWQFFRRCCFGRCVACSDLQPALFSNPSYARDFQPSQFFHALWTCWVKSQTKCFELSPPLTIVSLEFNLGGFYHVFFLAIAS